MITSCNSFSRFSVPSAFLGTAHLSFTPPLLLPSSTSITNCHQQQQQITQTPCGQKTQQALLVQLAREQEGSRPQDKEDAPAVRALTWALQDAEDVHHVDALLQGLQFPLPVYSSVIRSLSRIKNGRAAFAVCKWIQSRPISEGKPKAYVYNRILGVINGNGNYELARQVLEEMKKNGVEPDIVTYNSVIGLCEKQGLHNEAMELFWVMQEKRVCPDIATYKALLGGIGKLEDVDGGFELILNAKDECIMSGKKELVQKLEELILEFCDRQIRAWLENKDSPINVPTLLKKMEEAQIELPPGNYKKLLWLCGKREKDHVLVKALHTILRKKNVPIDVFLCNHAIRLLRTAKKWWAALEVYEYMLASGPQPNKETYAIIRSQFNFLLNASRKRRNFKWALQLLDKMEAKGIEPDRFAWDTALVTCAQATNSAAAVFVFQKMIEHGQKPSLCSYGALLSALEKGALFNKAEMVWKHMKRTGLRPNIEAYTTMISVYGGAGKQEELMRLVDEMRMAGISPNLITFNALITASVKAGSGKRAHDWFQQMEATGITPDATTYDQLVKALCLEGKRELARDTYIKAELLKFNLSTSAYDSVLNSCRFYDSEADVFTQMNQRSINNEAKLQ